MPLRTAFTAATYLCNLITIKKKIYLKAYWVSETEILSTSGSQQTEGIYLLYKIMKCTSPLRTVTHYTQTTVNKRGLFSFFPKSNTIYFCYIESETVTVTEGIDGK